MLKKIIALSACLAFAGLASTRLCAQGKAQPAWPAAVREVNITSRYDGSPQPSLFWAPADKNPHPLLVALHTWSGDYRQDTSIPYAEWCLAHGWVFVHPNFRGPNFNSLACGSEAAMQDVLDAVDYAKKNASLDESRIYLVGQSGGGYLTLLLAGRSPRTWTAASAWVPISDLAAWYRECSGNFHPQPQYAENLLAVCGGAPGSGPTADREYALRSPLSWLAAAAGLPLDINSGIHDGHTGSVPVNHALRAFNIVALANGKAGAVIPEPLVQSFVREEAVPRELAAEREDDPAYGERSVLFRRQAGPARVTVFAGTHEIVYEAALGWLEKQKR